MSAPLKRLKNRDGEGGFTLIEVMVVVLVIGILLAIGVPTFLGARTRAQDRAAQTSLRTGQTAAMVYFTDQASLEGAFAHVLKGLEPSIEWIATTQVSTNPNSVSVNPVDEHNWYAAAMSASGTCFTIHVDTQGSTDYGQTTNNCTGAQATAPTSTSW